MKREFKETGSMYAIVSLFVCVAMPLVVSLS